MGGSDLSTRALAWTGIDRDEVATSKLRSLRRLLLLTLGCEAWVALRYDPYANAPGLYGLVAAAASILAILGWRDRFARAAVVGSLVLTTGTVLSTFPDNANHHFLALLLLLLVALVGPEDDEMEFTPNAIAALQAARWISVLGLAWAGVMKLYYGYWFEAEFLAFRIAHDPGFARFFGPLMTESELIRLTGLGHEIGAGPFRADAPLIAWISNLTWIGELALPLGLLFSRTRLFSVIGAIALMAAIELGAREIFFGGLMLGLLLLFLSRDRLAAALPWIAAGYFAWMLRPELSTWLGQGGLG